MPVKKSQKNHPGVKLACRIRWNFAQQNVVVKVKHKSMESSNTNLEMVAYEFSKSTIRLMSQTVALRKPNSRAVKYASGTHTTPKAALKTRMNV